MKDLQNQFRSQNGSIYSSNSYDDEVVKFDTLKRELHTNEDSDSVGVLHASVVHVNNNQTDI